MLQPAMSSASNTVSVEQPLRSAATFRRSSVIRILLATAHMDRTRQADRSQLIRTSMLVFSVLAILSFTLARVPW